MSVNDYLKIIESIESSLVGKEVSKAQHSIAANIFIGFGKSLGGTFSDGTPRSMREWELWVSNAAWKLTQDGRFVVGSESHLSDIETKIQRLLKKKFISMRITSQFLDVDFIFDYGYILHIFFYWRNDNQWAFFFPNIIENPDVNLSKNDINLRIQTFCENCQDYSIAENTVKSTLNISRSTDDKRNKLIGHMNVYVSCETTEEIRNLMELSLKLPIYEKYDRFTDMLDGKLIKRISLDDERIFIVCEDLLFFAIDTRAWRVEKDRGFHFGSFRGGIKDEQLQARLQVLVGQRIKRIDAANQKNDLRVQIGDHYVLKTFADSEWDQWFIDFKDETILSNEVQVADS